MPEPYPESYLKTFEPFVDDSKSKLYASKLLDHYLAKVKHLDFDTWQMLDVCCGTGLMGQAIESHLSSTGKIVETTFLDISATILEKITLNGRNCTICADTTSMSVVKPQSFDIVVCRYGFNNLSCEDWLKALGEVLRVLRPGGIFLLQDHFVPGPVFSALINEAEQFLAKMEKKQVVPFIFSTEAFNAILDEHPLVASRIKSGYGLFINIWDRLRAKNETIPDFNKARKEILSFYEETCLKKYKVFIIDPEEYIYIYNVTYAIVKRS